MNKETAQLLGYVVAKFPNGEIWAFKRHSEYYPHQYTWFTYLPAEERKHHGILLDEEYEKK